MITKKDSKTHGKDTSCVASDEAKVEWDVIDEARWLRRLPETLRPGVCFTLKS